MEDRTARLESSDVLHVLSCENSPFPEPDEAWPCFDSSLAKTKVGFVRNNVF